MNLILTALLFAGSILGVEGYLRATIPSSSGGSLFESTLNSRRYKLMKPNARVIVYGSEFRTNKLGFRDNKAEVAPRRSSVFRIIVLGDSFTASAGVDFEQIYTSLLEADLRDGPVSVEVINLAVGGYNPIQYALVLDEVGLSLRPDLILVAVFPFNDLSSETYRGNYDAAIGRERSQGRVEIPPTHRWYEELLVYRAYLVRVENRVRSWFEPSEFTPDKTPQNEQIKRDAEENLDALKRLVDVAAAHDIPVVVGLLPNTDVFERQRGDFAPFEALCKERQWNCLNMLDLFIASGERPSALRLNVLDPHPNEQYNRLVAKFMSDYLRASVEALNSDRAARSR